MIRLHTQLQDLPTFNAYVENDNYTLFEKRCRRKVLEDIWSTSPHLVVDLCANEVVHSLACVSAFSLSHSRPESPQQCRPGG